MCVAAAGCGRGGGGGVGGGESAAGGGDAARPDPGRIVVTEDDPSLPRGCRPAEVAARLQELFELAHRGDWEAVRAMLVDPGMVESVEASAKPSRLRLRAVIVGYANGLGQIELEVVGRRYGKGAVRCGTGKFAAIGVSADAHPGFAPVCGGEPRGAVLACVRHWR